MAVAAPVLLSLLHLLELFGNDAHSARVWSSGRSCEKAVTWSATYWRWQRCYGFGPRWPSLGSLGLFLIPKIIYEGRHLWPPLLISINNDVRWEADATHVSKNCVFKSLRTIHVLVIAWLLRRPNTSTLFFSWSHGPSTPKRSLALHHCFVPRSLFLAVFTLPSYPKPHSDLN